MTNEFNLEIEYKGEVKEFPARLLYVFIINKFLLFLLVVFINIKLALGYSLLSIGGGIRGG
jgi:hypothetical protein